MLAPSLRRTVAVAASAAAALFASPLLGNSAAATFAGTMSSTPAANSSGVIAANRPTLTGTFNSALNHTTSTITLVEKGTTTNLCGSKTFSSNSLAISCTPTADLKLGKTYDATAHGVSAADSSTTADAPQLEFTVDYPVYATSTPLKNGTLTGSGPITVRYTTDTDLDASRSTITLKDFIDGQPANHQQGTSSVSSSSGSVLGGTQDTITFTPTYALSNGAEYEAVVHAEFSGNPAAHADDIIDFWVTNAPPSNLALGAPFANNTNDTAFPFTGIGNAGQTVTVTVTGTATQTPPVGNNTPSGSAVVPPCGSETCPFTVNVNVSGLKDGTLTSAAQSADGDGNATASVAGPDVILDTTAPNATQPTASIPAGSSKLTVTAGNPDAPTADVASYSLKITDADGHVQGPASYQPDSNDGLTLSGNNAIDVNGLDDGTLTIAVQAVDGHGNASPVDPSKGTGTTTVTKDVGLQPEFDSSTVTAGGDDIALPVAASHPIQTVTKVTLRFSEPVTNWTDSTNPLAPTPHNTVVCVEDKNSSNGANCQNGATTISSTDAHVVTTTLTTRLADASGYHIWYDAWPKAFCSDVSAPQSSPPAGCVEAKADVVNASNQTFVFTVDDTAPTVHVSYVTSPITSDLSSNINGTVSPDVSTMRLTIRSSAQPSNTRLVNVPVSPPAQGTNVGTWSLSPLPLSGIADGTLNVTAVGTDAAGNSGSAPATATLNALSLRVASGDGAATVSWRKPALAGGSAPHYTLTYADLSAGTSAKTVAPASSATSYVVRGLVNGHVYSITLHAGDNDGDGPTAIGTAKPRYLTAITAKASPAATIVYGTSMTLSGQLLAKNYNAGINGQKLTIRPTLYNGKVGATTTVTTSGAGAWKLAVGRLAKDTTYVIAYAGSSRYTPAARKLLIFVKVSLAITSVSARNSSHTSPVTLRGGVGPNQSGRYVYVYEHTASGNRLLGKVKLSSKSTFAFTHTFGRGRHYVFVKFLTQNGNIGNTSKTVSFSRT